MTIEQIKSIIAGAEETLRLLQSQREYQIIENNFLIFSQTDDRIVLEHSIEILAEIYCIFCENENAILSLIQDSQDI